METQPASPAEAQTDQEVTSKAAPNLDSELDAALSKTFANIKIETNEPIQEKAEPKVEDKKGAEEIKVESKKPVEEDKSALPDPEQIEAAPPGKVSNQSKEGWNALRNNYKKAHRIAQEKDVEITKLKASLAEKGTLSAKETETLKSQIQELSKYRAMVDIQADPEFMSKFDQPIQKAEGNIKAMLEEMNVSKAIIDQVDFSNTKLMDEIIGHVGEHRDKITARKLQRKVEELIDLTDKRDETLEEQKNNYQQLLEEKKKQSFTKDAESEGRMIKHLENIASAKDKTGNSIFPFLSQVAPKEGATQMEVDQVNNHNKMVELMGQKLQSVFKMNTPEEKAEVAVAAVASHYLNAQLKTAMAKIKSLEAEIGKISVINSETERPKGAAIKRNGNGDLLSTDEALADFLAKR